MAMYFCTMFFFSFVCVSVCVCVFKWPATWSKVIPGVFVETMKGDSMTVAVYNRKNMRMTSLGAIGYKGLMEGKGQKLTEQG